MEATMLTEGTQSCTLVADYYTLCAFHSILLLKLDNYYDHIVTI